MTFRAGDVVQSIADPREEYVLACDEEHGYAATCGWPDGCVRTAEFRVTLAATDAEREKMLRDIAKSACVRRRGMAQRQLHKSKLCVPDCEHCASERADAIAAAEQEIVRVAMAWRETPVLDLTEWAGLASACERLAKLLSLIHI